MKNAKVQNTDEKVDNIVVPKVDTKVETKVVPKVEPKTIASVFKLLGIKGSKTRKTLAEEIIASLKERGITKNVKGKDIILKNVVQQVSAMLRDIKQERGKKTGSWWSKYTIVENENEVKIVPKV
jgi:hypothetical protein